MTVMKAIIASGFAAAFTTSAHPPSADVLRPAPVYFPAAVSLANPDYLPQGTIETSAMGMPGSEVTAADPDLMAIQKHIVGMSGLKAGDCAMLAVMIGRDGHHYDPVMITQIFTVRAGQKGLIAERISSGYSTVKESTDVAYWLNAYEYAYRVPTQNVTTRSGVPAHVSLAKLKSCP